MAATDIVTEELLDALSAAIATRYNTLKGKVGDTADLATTAKSTLVAAINEVHSSIAGAAGINDAATSTSSTYSSQKVVDLIAALKTEILGGATSAYDTLQELKALLDASDSADDSAIASLTTALGNRLRFDAAQTLDSTQKAQALANLGLVASTSDFAGTFNTATA